jgi:hypothetical protein
MDKTQFRHDVGELFHRCFAKSTRPTSGPQAQQLISVKTLHALGLAGKAQHSNTDQIVTFMGTEALRIF